MEESTELSKVFVSIRQEIGRHPAEIQKECSGIGCRRNEIIGAGIENDESIRILGFRKNGFLDKEFSGLEPGDMFSTGQDILRIHRLIAIHHKDDLLIGSSIVSTVPKRQKYRQTDGENKQ